MDDSLKDVVKSERVNNMKQVVEQQLQQCIVNASEYRTLIGKATTQTKKRYYTKKMKTVSAQVHQLVAIVQQLEAISSLKPGEDANENVASVIS